MIKWMISGRRGFTDSHSRLLYGWRQQNGTTGTSLGQNLDKKTKRQKDKKTNNGSVFNWGGWFKHTLLSSVAWETKQTKQKRQTDKQTLVFSFFGGGYFVPNIFLHSYLFMFLLCICPIVVSVCVVSLGRAGGRSDTLTRG